MPTVIQVKRGTASSWTSANTILAAGEIGFESDTKKMKVGDGSTAWTSLLYTATPIASQTGTGTKLVVDTSPTLVTPNIGAATATSVNGTTIPTSKTLVATDSTVYVVPSQTGNSGKYLTTNGTVSSWGTVNSVPAVSVATTLNTYTAFSAQPLGGQVLNVGTSAFYLSQYGSYVQNDADIFNAAFPVGSVITATSATQTGTFTITQAATINGGGYIITNNITTSEASNIFFSGATTLSRGTSTSGKYLTNNGTATSWATPAGGGKVLQVVQGTFATSSTTTSATYTDTGLTVNITPSSATSKVLIMVHHNGNKKNQTGQYTSGKFKVLRGGTTLLDQTEISWQNVDVITNMNWSWAYLDSPATTSVTTYKTQYGARVNSESFTICVDGAFAPSTIIAMEIGA